jgi:hypothetical protein
MWTIETPEGVYGPTDWSPLFTRQAEYFGSCVACGSIFPRDVSQANQSLERAADVEEDDHELHPDDPAPEWLNDWVLLHVSDGCVHFEHLSLLSLTLG